MDTVCNVHTLHCSEYLPIVVSHWFPVNRAELPPPSLPKHCFSVAGWFGVIVPVISDLIDAIHKLRTVYINELYYVLYYSIHTVSYV